ncbi:MAG TPA: HAD-IA family hydrolase [bacterium]|nr:HAD-IA family hydrolase [bacterium]
MPHLPIQAIFLDVGGVLLTNGWDRAARRAAAEKFGLDAADLEERHHLTYDTYEVGKISLETYLDRVIFHVKRDFSREDFRSYMYAQTQALPGMIDYFTRLKQAHGLRVGVISNEGRELSEYRIQHFHLGELADFFVMSAFVHFRKPDTDIFKLALDIAQVPARQCLYFDDRPLFVEVARRLGLHAVHHRGLASTQKAVEALGLTLP